MDTTSWRPRRVGSAKCDTIPYAKKGAPPRPRESPRDQLRLDPALPSAGNKPAHIPPPAPHPIQLPPAIHPTRRRNAPHFLPASGPRSSPRAPHHQLTHSAPTRAPPYPRRNAPDASSTSRPPLAPRITSRARHPNNQPPHAYPCLISIPCSILRPYSTLFISNLHSSTPNQTGSQLRTGSGPFRTVTGLRATLRLSVWSRHQT